MDQQQQQQQQQDSSVVSDGASATSPQQPPVTVKCVAVGDSCVGKTASLISYTTNGFPNAYTPTTYDTYSIDVRVDHRWCRVALCDTPGLDHFEQIRPLAYPDAHVFLLCFAVAQPESLESLKAKWLPELNEHAPAHAARLLIGLKSDQRDDASILLDLSLKNSAPVSKEEAEKACRQLGALEYIECSALTQKCLKEVFDTAIWAGSSVQEALATGAAASGKSGKSRGKKSKSSKVSDQSGCKLMAKRGADGARQQQQKSSGLLQRLFCVADHSAN
ncbi:hypothetical protein BOX15_Mlig003733g2 [Macrostomum lignano]|uniref:Uncharacterized protein n=1 Tax=Macrostomum lignano TaxID=282301 RepID=A0A267FFG5_9PLAT|nr:hypothetical protein BOX15_Mlig003733g2 [Macrostomum lignano]